MTDKFAELKNYGGCGSHKPGHKCCGKHKHHHADENHAHDGCCGSHNHGDSKSDELTEDEQQLLSAVEKFGCIPVVRFVMKSSKSSHFESTALSAVYIMSAEDDMQDVKSRAKLFTSLEDKGLLSIDYDAPVSNYDYSEFTNSNIYKDFVTMMKESAGNEDFVFDIADMDKGSVALI